MIRVVLAEDHFLVREGTRRLLESTGMIEVAAAVDNPDELLAAIRLLEPDVAIVDIRMPPTHQTEGIEAAHLIRSSHPDVGIVILSQHSNPMYALDLFRDGTDGLAYLLKDRVGDVKELLRAITRVAEGGSVVDPKVVDGLVNRRRRLSESMLDTLTPRELDVLAEMAQGKSNGAVADSLFISQSAVEKHINSIFVKLGLSQEEAETHRRVAAVLAYLKDRE